MPDPPGDVPSLSELALRTYVVSNAIFIGDPLLGRKAPSATITLGRLSGIVASFTFFFPVSDSALGIPSNSVEKDFPPPETAPVDAYGYFLSASLAHDCLTILPSLKI